jgi:Bacterial SH3 domain
LRNFLPIGLAVSLACGLLAVSGCQSGRSKRLEYGYVAAAQVSLRDRVAPVFEKTGAVADGARVEVLERSKNGRFVRVRSPREEEGWMEQRYLSNQAIFDKFQIISQQNSAAPVQGHATTRAILNMHIDPERDSPHLYQLKEAERVELLKRTIAERKMASSAQSVPAAPIMEDWWLVRDSAKHTGWVLGRIIDIEAPIEVAQYAEGQRIIACFVLNHVEDDGKNVPQYVMLLNEPKDGNPTDFNQVRVFTWNTKRDRYETAYRERKLAGMLPASIGTQEFDKEGKLPTFTLLLGDGKGETRPVTFKMNGVIVRKLTSSDEVVKAPAQPALPPQPAAEAPASPSGK